MKILVLGNDGTGLYNFRRELLAALIAGGNSVSVSLPRDAHVPSLEALGCAYVETDVDRRGMNPLHDLALLGAYLKMLRRLRPDLVLAYTVKPNIYGGLACRLNRTPCVSNITGIGTALVSGGLLRRFVLALYRLGLRGSPCVFFQNTANRELFVRERIVAAERTRLLPGSGVNLERHRLEAYPPPEAPTAFLYAGRMMREKGIEELLEASARVRARHPEVLIHLVGECEEDYRTRLEAATQAGIIRYHGFSDNMHAFFSSSHATVLPSYHEGTSNVLLESAATGRPVLASRVPGCRETFDEGVSGLGFEPRDADSLEQAMLDFIALPYEQKRAMGLAGRRKMEREYDRQIVVSSCLAEIGHIMASGADRRKAGDVHEPV